MEKILSVSTVSVSGLIFVFSQTDIPESFKCPFVPVFPILGIYCNIYMMADFKAITWIRMIVLLVVGLIIYFAYSIRRSKLAIQQDRSVLKDDELSKDFAINNGSELMSKGEAWGDVDSLNGLQANEEDSDSIHIEEIKERTQAEREEREKEIEKMMEGREDAEERKENNENVLKEEEIVIEECMLLLLQSQEF